VTFPAPYFSPDQVSSLVFEPLRLADVANIALRIRSPNVVLTLGLSASDLHDKLQSGGNRKSSTCECQHAILANESIPAALNGQTSATLFWMFPNSIDWHVILNTEDGS